ncbi:gmp synthase glutamine-hydrolysing [Trichoderma arundinaceum]|uniref:Gmp synthase glutamine-hydrolysing n=1 Tax=Trichoderma arundinaceum TaxID=490622 RepID=A0A395NN77_TRIAR|nr:gmp synthase glutamine-hydrolysing [Trichoderma arundinaceum]
MTADAISGSGPASGSPAQPLRLLILEADTPQPNTKAKYGGFRGVFAALLTAGAAAMDPPRQLSEVATVTAHNIVDDMHSYPPLDEVDAILITGSRHTAYEDDPWILKLVEYARQAIETGRVRVVGVCFGHQIIGRAMGARLGRSDKGWEVAVTDVDLTDKGKAIFQLDKMRIHQMHRDIVLEFPKDSIPLGSNDKCEVQAMYSPGRYITVQGHPEFTGEIISEILTNRHKVGIFTDEVYKDAMERAPIEHDGVTIAKAFLNFMKHG